MRRILLAVALSFASITTAEAAPVTGAAREGFAGGWRAGGCGADADANAPSFTLEFALTGGRMNVDSGSETGGPHRVNAIDVTASKITFTLDGSKTWRFTRGPDGVLVSQAPLDLYPEMKGLSFHLCQKPADRSAIHLDAKQTAQISDAMPMGPVLIDARAGGGCKATLYQYLDFDLVGPLGFVLHRWNSPALGERLADGGKAKFPTDEISDFVIDKADAVPGGYRFTITELIPPNGSRGDTTTITVKLGPDHTAEIAEWRRHYKLCVAPA